MTPARLRWGLLFIAIGGMLLATQADWVDEDFWLALLNWWPVLLIAIGIEKIFVKSKLRFISYLSPVMLVAFMVYIALETGPPVGDRGFFSQHHWSSRFDPDITLTEASINHGRSDIRVNVSRSDLARARFGRFLRKPRIDFSIDDGVAYLDIKRRFGINPNFITIERGKFNWRDWTANFSNQIPLKLSCDGYESDVDLALSEVPVHELRIDNDEGDIYLKIGVLVPEIDVFIAGDDARFTLRIPDTCAIKVTGDGYDAYFKKLDLIEEGDYFISDEFDSAMIKLNLTIEDQLRHFSIDYY